MRPGSRQFAGRGGRSCARQPARSTFFLISGPASSPSRYPTTHRVAFHQRSQSTIVFFSSVRSTPMVTIRFSEIPQSWKRMLYIRFLRTFSNIKIARWTKKNWWKIYEEPTSGKKKIQWFENFRKDAELGKYPNEWNEFAVVPKYHDIV